MTSISKFPLCWPDNVVRRPPHMRGQPKFEFKSVERSALEILREINRLNRNWHSYEDHRVIISTNLQLRRDGLPMSNQSEPTDGGVAVYFTLDIQRAAKTIERPCVLTCDKWAKVGWNLDAIWRDIEAQRARLRFGCTNLEQSFRGYLAIPERAGGLSWWEALGVPSTASANDIKRAYIERAKTEHPNSGGDPAKWAKVQEAYDQALSQRSEAA